MEEGMDQTEPSASEERDKRRLSEDDEERMKKQKSDDPSVEPTKQIPKSTAGKKIKLIIEHEVFKDYKFKQQPSDAAKSLLINFAYEAVMHVTKREPDDVIMATVAAGFNALEARIAALEKKEEDSAAKVEACVKNVGNNIKEIKEAKMPSAASKAYAVAAKKLLDDDLPLETIAKEANLKKDNAFTVLDLEEKVKDDDGFQVVKKRLASKFRGKKIRVEKVVRTKGGNISFEYQNAEEQKKAEEVLRSDPIPRANI